METNKEDFWTETITERERGAFDVLFFGISIIKK